MSDNVNNANDRAGRSSVVWLVVLVVVSFAVGFLVLPSVQKDYTADGLWAAICRAAGVPTKWGSGEPSAPPTRTTRVVLDQSMTRVESPEAIGRGGSLAIQQCTMCHGAQGVSAADTPNLAGQYRDVMVKQLLDYKNGDRESTIMQALATRLSAGEINDLAAYYASLEKTRRAPRPYDEPAPALVRVGDPLRNIAPCASCHGGIDRKPGTPWLEGMPKQYLVDQLKRFASGARRNDSHAQMRNMAREMSAAEIDEVAEYYARHGEAKAGH
ncbi:MAG TPA: c-type cytochrome [Burkholderiales bacterium]|nr:c-type cytochrome [Burkholderiales bacterium]